MLDYTISKKGIKREQIGVLLTFIVLIIINTLFYIFTNKTNALIIALLTVLLGLIFNFLGNKIYRVHFLNEDILISNLLHKERKYSNSEFDKITTFFSMAGIYRLSLKNGETYLFQIEIHKLAKNLLNIDSDKYARELTDEIKERIISSTRFPFKE